MKKIVIALVVAATSTIALAQDAGPRFHARGPRADRLAEKLETLNLTEAQKQQMKDLRAAGREQNKQLYADLRGKLQELRALKQAGDPKATDVKAQIQAMHPQIQATRKASRQAMLNVLTPEQRAELKAARHSRGLGRGQARAMRGIVAGKLNFTDEQRAQLKQLRQSDHQENAQLFDDARAKRQEFHSLMRAGDPRASDVKAQLEALRPQLEAARKQQHNEFLNVLTPEQRAQLEQWKAERQSRRPSR
jgi:Spy/CpxP family protein refolding chaperone